MFLIKGNYCCGDQLYWSNEDGWVDMDGNPTLFHNEEKEHITMPDGATGVTYLQVAPMTVWWEERND
jgi:hypothetical protein